LQRGRCRSCFLQCGSCSLRRREIGRHLCGMSRLLFFPRVSWVSLAGCGAGEEEIARSRVLRVRAAARSNSVRASGRRPSWRRFGIRVKNGHKAVSNESGCGLSVGQVVHVESEPAKSANLLSYAEWCRSDQGWVTGCPFLDMADSTSVRSAALESLTAFATGLAYFSCFSCIRQIQIKIAGRASTRDRRGDHEMRTHLWFAKWLCLTLKGFLSYLGRSAHLVVSVNK
jgi:hypothetical protein